MDFHCASSLRFLVSVHCMFLLRVFIAAFSCGFSLRLFIAVFSWCSLLVGLIHDCVLCLFVIVCVVIYVNTSNYVSWSLCLKRIIFVVWLPGFQ